MVHPLVTAIPFQDPWETFTAFYKEPWALFLDSANKKLETGKYSFIAVDPFLTFTLKNTIGFLNNKKIMSTHPFKILLHKMLEFPLFTMKDTAPFQGGVAGLFSYDLNAYLEKLPLLKDDQDFSDMAVGFYDLVIGFNHHTKKAWIFSSGYPEKNRVKQKVRAEKRTFWLQKKLEKKNEYNFPLTLRKALRITSNFTEAAYHHAVKKAKKYILAGDIFQVNISQRFETTCPKHCTPFDIYSRLRLLNPAPFSAYFTFQDSIIVSASPERFMKIIKGNAETCPIKGTRARSPDKKEDQALAKALTLSEKDRSENIMIVDLMRNDFSKVCKDHSVKVIHLCHLQSFQTVHHLVSTIQGTLKQNLHALDLLQASFPGGSITGAPKVRAMEIISEIEGIKRGPYCGSIGYIGFNGDMDSSILIRTIAFQKDRITFQAGGAIVLDSNPKEEYEETLTKAGALKESLTTTL